MGSYFPFIYHYLSNSYSAVTFINIVTGEQATTRWRDAVGKTPTRCARIRTGAIKSTYRRKSNV